MATQRQDSTGRDDARAEQVTALGVPLADAIFLFAVIPGSALAIAWFLPAAARWALSFENWLPFRAVFRVAGSIDRPWEIGVHLTLWAVAGIAIGLTGWGESATAQVSDDELAVTRDGQSQVVLRRDASSVFPDGGDLVVLDRQSREVLREKLAAPLTAVEAALRKHRYPWQDADPHAALYRPWTLGSPDLPPAAHALLSARATAIRTRTSSGQVRQQARERHDALQELGYAVRDQDGVQQWRPLVRD